MTLASKDAKPNITAQPRAVWLTVWLLQLPRLGKICVAVQCCRPDLTIIGNLNVGSPACNILTHTTWLMVVMGYHAQHMLGQSQARSCVARECFSPQLLAMTVVSQ